LRMIPPSPPFATWLTAAFQLLLPLQPHCVITGGVLVLEQA
jgi:hypothetical protein